MEPKNRNRLVAIGRWIAVLPAAVIGGLVGYSALKVPAMLLSAIVPGRSVTNLDELLYTAVSGFLFILAGAIVAPNGRKVASVVLLILYAVLTGIGIVGYGVQGDQLGIAALITGVVGAGVGLYFGFSLKEADRSREAS